MVQCQPPFHAKFQSPILEMVKLKEKHDVSCHLEVFSLGHWQSATTVLESSSSGSLSTACYTRSSSQSIQQIRPSRQHLHNQLHIIEQTCDGHKYSTFPTYGQITLQLSPFIMRPVFGTPIFVSVSVFLFLVIFLLMITLVF